MNTNDNRFYRTRDPEPLGVVQSVDGNRITYSPVPRKDTLLNELRALLVNYTPLERTDLFDLITEGYCRDCGDHIERSKACSCRASGR